MRGRTSTSEKTTTESIDDEGFFYVVPAHDSEGEWVGRSQKL